MVSEKDPYQKRRKKLEDKERKWVLEKEPREKKPPRRKLRIIDIISKSEEELGELE